MKKIILFLALPLSALYACGQVASSYTVPIQHDTAIQWAAACDKVINLSPKISEYSLKKWYLNKLKQGTVTAYRENTGSNSVSPYDLSMPGLQIPGWLKGLAIELSPTKHPQEWYFVDNTKGKDDHERGRYRAGNLNLAADSCCGCDEADAFRAKQVLSYKNGKFSIYNVFISPLCVRPTAVPPSDWYPLCNVAYNDNAERKFPGLSKEVVLLNTNEIDYDFNAEKPSSFDSVLTVYRTDIGSLIYQDVLKGRLRPIGVETGQPIPVKKFLTWQMPADTMAVYDVNDPSKILGYKVVQAERSSREFSRMRIKQDLYFDFTNERLYAVIRSVILMLPVKMYDGTIRGYIAFCRLE